MNKFDLNALNVDELSVNEMSQVNGGWIAELFEAVGDICEAIGEGLKKLADNLREIGL